MSEMPVSSMELVANKENGEAQEHGIPAGRELTNYQTYMHLFKGNVGLGMLSLGLHFAEAGVPAGLAILAIVGAQAMYGQILLLQVQQTVARMTRREAQSLSYEDLAEIVFGSWARRVVQISVFAINLGVCTLIISFLRTGLGAEIQGANPSTGQRAVSTFLVICVCTGLSLLPDLKSLTVVSLAGNIGLMLAVAAMVQTSFYEFSTPDGPVDPENPFIPARPTLENCSALLAAAFYAIEGICLTLPIGNAMGKEAASGYPKIIGQTMAAIVLVFAIYAGFVGAAFPGNTMDTTSITSFMSKRAQKNNYTTWVWSLVNWIVSASLSASFPLYLMPVVQVIETAFPGPLHSSNAKTGLRIGLCVLCAVTGLTMKKADLMDIVGATTNTILAGLPFAMHLSLEKNVDAKDKKPLLLLVDVSVLLLCGLVFACGMYKVIWKSAHLAG